MSSSLGPIHYLMYEKILMQDELTAALLEGRDDEKAALDRALAPVRHGDLAALIDQDNIHGWLSAAIDRAEIRQATALKAVGTEEGCRRAYAFGRLKNATVVRPEDNGSLFEAINGLILDGMPCDRGLSAYEEEGALVLHQNVALHDLYALKALGDLDPRDSLGKTCSGNHDHDRHESFELQQGPKRTPGVGEGAEAVEPFYCMRQALLQGFVEPWGYRVLRRDRDFVISR